MRDNKLKMSATQQQVQGELWEVVHPSGEVDFVHNLKKWCRDKKIDYFNVWGNRKGFKTNRVKSDAYSAKAEGYVHIIDQLSGEVLVSTTNAIHWENMSEALAMGIANRPSGYIHDMAFGNGASTVSGIGAVTYFPPNVTGQSANLYNQTYSKVVNDMSPFNTDPVNNNLRVQHTQNTTYSDLIITCTLNSSEPPGQLPYDVSTNDGMESPYVFDELGVKGFSPNEGQGKLLTHVIFHPVQKSQNRTIEIVYTIRIFMS